MEVVWRDGKRHYASTLTTSKSPRLTLKLKWHVMWHLMKPADLIVKPRQWLCRTPILPLDNGNHQSIKIFLLQAGPTSPFPAGAPLSAAAFGSVDVYLRGNTFTLNKLHSAIRYHVRNIQLISCSIKEEKKKWRRENLQIISCSVFVEITRTKIEVFKPNHFYRFYHRAIGN